MLLPIACAITSNYVLPLLVMLASLKERLRPSYRPILYLVGQRIDEHQLDVISDLVETHTLVPTSASVAAIPRHPHFPAEAAYPLLLPDLVPESLERILFLDADLLVLDDLVKLWQTDLGSHTLAAAADSAIPLCSSPRGVKQVRELGIPEDAPYFNCGVMLIHLGRWRQRNVTRRAHDYLRKMQGRVDFLHQEALNATLWNDWQRLDCRWNLLASLAGRSYEQAKSEAWRTPGIVHFAGRMKPWRNPIGGPFDAPYRAVLSEVTRLLPAAKPTLQSRLLSLYDRHCRNYLYGCERALWKRRLF